jgi:hypothetical protein
MPTVARNVAPMLGQVERRNTGPGWSKRLAGNAGTSMPSAGTGAPLMRPNDVPVHPRWSHCRPVRAATSES